MSREARHPITGSIMKIAGYGGVSNDHMTEVLRDAEVVSGKNLLDPSWFENYSGCTVTPVYNNGKLVKYTLSGTTTSLIAINFAKRVTFDLILPVGETFVFSIGATLPFGFLVVGYTHPTTGAWTVFKYQSTDNLEFTVPAEAEGMAWNIQYAPQNNQTFNNLDIYPMLCTLSEWQKSHEYEPYYVPVKNAMLRREEQRVLGAKNLVPYPHYQSTRTTNGITFTDNGDGSVTVNGTATEQAGHVIIQEKVFPNGTHLAFNGCPSGGSLTTYRLRLERNPNPAEHRVDDYGEGGELVVTNNETLRFLIIIAKGVTCNNLVFKPMIRLASDPDDTYVPYAMTNRELTEIKTGDFTATVTSGSATPTYCKYAIIGKTCWVHFRIKMTADWENGTIIKFNTSLPENGLKYAVCSPIFAGKGNVAYLEVDASITLSNYSGVIIANNSIVQMSFCYPIA